jgi:septum formation protein
MNKVILASSSPRRKVIFEKFGIPFSVIVPHVKEIRECIHLSLVPLINAEKKSFSISQRYPDSYVISADTVIEYREKLIGKPSNISDAKKMLSIFSCSTHVVITAVCIRRKCDNYICLFADSSRVRFKKLTPQIIEGYLLSVNPLDKAGGYSAFEKPDMVIEKIDGDPSNVAGLPVGKLSAALSIITPLKMNSFPRYKAH